jgi:hypothetical protein
MPQKGLKDLSKDSTYPTRINREDYMGYSNSTCTVNIALSRSDRNRIQASDIV